MIVYFMTGLRLDAGAFFANLFTTLLIVLVAQSYGLAIGAFISDPQSAQTVATIFTLGLMLVGVCLGRLCVVDGRVLLLLPPARVCRVLVYFGCLCFGYLCLGCWCVGRWCVFVARDLLASAAHISAFVSVLDKSRRRVTCVNPVHRRLTKEQTSGRGMTPLLCTP